MDEDGAPDWECDLKLDVVEQCLLFELIGRSR